MNGWIITYTGKRFYPGNPVEDNISIFDIAHSLALTCRYNGHCKEFYSVAEHSVRMCDMLPRELKLPALLHDSAEAYLGDMLSLLKDTLFKEYRLLEDTLLTAILHKFNVTPVKAEAFAQIKKAEYSLTAAEVRDLMNRTEGWCLPEKPPEVIIHPWSWAVAEKTFLDRFYSHHVGLRM